MKKLIGILSALDYLDAALFFAFFLIPTLAVVVLKLAGAPQWMVTALPVLAMFLYAGLMMFARRLRLRNDQAGDNLYYLGFLFTLVSLSASLVEFTISGGAHYIVKNFGIALATTIAGVALRVGFSQMRRDPVEVERQARMELAEAARRLRAELDNGLLEFNSYRRATHQSVADGLIELQQMAEKVLSSATDKVEAAATTTASRIETAFAGFAEKAERFNASAGQITESVESLSRRVDAISAPSDLVAARIEPAFSGIGGIVEALENRARADAERSRELSLSAEEAANATATAFEKIGTAARTMETIPPVAERLAAALAAMEAQVGATKERVGAATGQLSDRLAGTEVQARIDEVTRALGDMAGVVERTILAWDKVRPAAADQS